MERYRKPGRNNEVGVPASQELKKVVKSFKLGLQVSKRPVGRHCKQFGK
jgi:hypothetical protein